MCIRDSPEKTYIATIHCPGSPTVTGVPSLVTIDNDQNCKVVIENCAPYEVTIERNDIMGIIEMEEDELYPLTDEAAAGICAVIKNELPNSPTTRLTKEDIARRCHLQVPDQYKGEYLDLLYK